MAARFTLSGSATSARRHTPEGGQLLAHSPPTTRVGDARRAGGHEFSSSREGALLRSRARVSVAGERDSARLVHFRQCPRSQCGRARMWATFKQGTLGRTQPASSGLALKRERASKLRRWPSLLVVAIGLLVGVLGTASADAPVRSLIVYGVYTEEGFGVVEDVYAVAPDGTGSRRILTGVEPGSPALSPNGTWVASTIESLVSIVRPDGSDRRVIWRRRSVLGHTDYLFIGQPSWSPGGTRLAVEASWEVLDDEGEASYEETRIVIMGVRTRAKRVLAKGGNPTWSPKGNLIAYTTDDSPNRIAVIRPDGSKMRFLVNDRKAYRRSLDFSPDGRRLLYFESSDRGRYRLRILDLHAKQRTTLRSGVSIEDAVWGPSGDLIA